MRYGQGMASPPLLTLQNIHLQFGMHPLLEGAELIINEYDRMCFVGRNGSGKSTLLKIAAGMIEPDKGTRFVRPNTTMRYLAQEPDLSKFKTTLDYVLSGENANVEHYRAQMVLENLGLNGQEQCGTLSGGEVRRAALAYVIAAQPDIILLDEPTNHLDLPTIEWLETELARIRSAVVIISHDRRFLTNVSKATLWLDRGITRKLSTGFGTFEAWRDDFLEQEELNHHKLSRKIDDELHWVRYGVTARRKRNVRRMGELQNLKTEYKTTRRATGIAKMDVSEADVSGKTVIEAIKIFKSYEQRPIVTDFSCRITRGERIGIVGANGAGKSTLVNMLIGLTKPDGGKVKQGTNLEIATLDQNRTALKPDATLASILTGGTGDTVFIGDKPRHVIGYMKDFLFTPDQMNTPVHVLSGGERGRLVLAKALATSSNLLVLDEPTNDLDLETLDVLQEMLGEYSGTVLLVSHDRDFLDRVCTSTIMAEGNGHFTVYAGGYADMVTQRGGGVLKRKVIEVEGELPTYAASSSGSCLAEARFQAKADGRGSTSESHAKKHKMSFKDKHALETLPAEIAKIEQRMAKIQELLADPNLYTQNAALFDRATFELAELDEKKSAAEERWLELEMLREEMG